MKPILHLMYTVFRHNFVYWAIEYAGLTKELAGNKAGVSFWRSLVSVHLIEIFLCRAIVKWTPYILVLEKNFVPPSSNLVLVEKYDFQQHISSPRYHNYERIFPKFQDSLTWIGNGDHPDLRISHTHTQIFTYCVMKRKVGAMWGVWNT